MRVQSRRSFLKSSLELSGALLLGCGDDAEPMPAPDGCADPFAGGSFQGSVPFVGEGDLPLETPYNQGLDGRLLTDLEKLAPDSLVTPTPAFYIRTRYPDLLVPPPEWSIAVSGHVAAPADLLLEDLLADEADLGTFLLECSGNGRTGHFGLLSAAAWSGIPMQKVLDRIAPTAAATRMLVSGFDEHSQPSANNHSTPGASWIFSFAELAEAGAFLATRMNGELLPPDHGEPVRLFVPGWYGCTCIKWVNAIELVDDTAPATSQMQEFASRTHQVGVPALARDYAPANIEQAAMPVRIEKWLLNGAIAYRVVGIAWGGNQPTNAFEIRFGNGPWEPVSVCPPMTTNATWTLWSHRWQPAAAGTHPIVLRVADPSVPQRRLDTQHYLREVAIDEV